MLELLIQGAESRQRIRTELLPGKSYEVGRAPDTDLPIPWDVHISRRHVRFNATAEYVDVERHSGATNPVFFAGKEVESCRLHIGERFVLGSTSFTVTKTDEVSSSPTGQPLEEMMFDQQDLKKIRFRDADKRIDVLSRLPEVIWAARTDLEFHDRLTNLLLAGVPQSDAVALVKLGDDDPNELEILHRDRRRETAGEFRPSGRLIHHALQTQQRTVLHVWESQDQSVADYTAAAEFDWAFCTPVSTSSGNRWGLYIAGRLDASGAGNSPTDTEIGQLQADVKFTEIVAEIISSVQRVKKLERQQSGLRQFFAAPILAMLGDDLNTEVLEPRLCEVYVLFCDLRGFSHQAEESIDDLPGLLDRVSSAFEVMTHQIHQFGGVTADFQGDAAIGFWGWPFATDDASLNACRAALGIRRAFAEMSHEQDHPLANFQMGIGIANGNAVAGKIGTVDHVKITVFGPVVNLASRLENLTKLLRVPVVLDEMTAEKVRSRLDPSEGRIRRLAKVLPYGLENVVTVSELLPAEQEFPELTDEHITLYEQGVAHFVDGRWEEAYACLHEMPATDRAQDFLGMRIAQHNRIAPPDWDGVIRLSSK